MEVLLLFVVGRFFGVEAWVVVDDCGGGSETVSWIGSWVFVDAAATTGAEEVVKGIAVENNVL